MKLAAVILSLAVVSGCTTTSKMNIVDLNYFKIDCNNQEEQLAFLRKQAPSQQDRMANALRITSTTGTLMSLSDRTYDEERATFDGRQEAVAKLLVYQIQNHCPRPQAKTQGCVHINETFPSGSSQGARCYQAANPRPVVNRWEMIDPK